MKKRSFKILLWIVSIVLFFGLVGFVVKKHNNTTCKSVEISIQAPAEYAFLTEDDVMSYLREAGGALVGSRLADIDIEKLEAAVNSKPYVLESKVYMSLRGVLKIDITQRTPIARVQPDVRLQNINDIDGSPYYITADGGMMPLVPGKTARVVFVNGNIRNLYNENIKLDVDSAYVAQDTLGFFSTMYSLYDVAAYIEQDKFLKAQIQQIFVDEKGELILIPEVGKHIVIFGDGKQIPQKFKRLKIFYEKAAFVKGWSYDTVNVKYNNQIICS
ncbi:MAG TPA: hypothetical protein PLB59_05600 [Bacteroidales bacterium]|nr:hypothetical protein [Bacteroidales bacterium]HQN15181.1 hypothetical protein [Bacteroidales bacterium]HQP15421.1 hypothetical protein [Bacteroidales bacterium]